MLVVFSKANSKGILIINPGAVGVIKSGYSGIHSSRPMMGNIVPSELYRSMSVGYISKSGSMSNELNIISIVTNRRGLRGNRHRR
ncbi:hypothetical protein H1R20_g15911, partial [Candolleomyces eurysporus]